MHIGLFKDSHLILSIQMNRDNIASWFELDPVRMISKERGYGYYEILLSSSVIGKDNLEPDGSLVYRYACFGDWICLDDKANWRLFSDEDYRSLNEKKEVYRPINQATMKQLLAFLTVNKMKEDFEKMSQEEKEEFAEKYPEFVKKV